ncbi:AI-2E family transporter [Candidatus Saccharibacteria bacterium]|nr:AI-2E family transporter [Candidatus Saccharibacteria bacterium]
MKSLAEKSWAIVGIALAVVIIYNAFSSLSALFFPLIIALVIGALFSPLVDKLSSHLPRKLASSIVLIGLIAISSGSIYVVASGLSEQAPALRSELMSGFNLFRNYLLGFGVDIGTGKEISNQLENVARNVTTSGRFGSVVGSSFSVIGGFVTGTVIALFMLYYVLTDWKKLNRWVSSNLGAPKDLAEGVLDDGVSSLRVYFSALTFTSLIVSVAIGLVAAFMGVPSAFAIAIITLITSYVPYIGGIFAGGFAVLLALGSQGLNTAMILLAVIIVVQLLVQPLLQNAKTSSDLDVHPAVIFASTIIGSTVAGILGAVLSGPVVAMILKINRRLKQYNKSK